MNDFLKRKNDIFNSLESAEKSMITSTSILDQSKPRDDNKTLCIVSERTTQIKHFRGKKESIFKTPALPISKCLKPRQVPSFQVNISVIL